MSKETVLTDEQIIEAANMADYSEMVTADDYIYVIARAIEAAVLESEEVKGWEKDAERYRKVRRMTLEQYSDIYQANIKTGAPFDFLVDAAKESNHD